MSSECLNGERDSGSDAQLSRRAQQQPQHKGADAADLNGKAIYFSGRNGERSGVLSVQNIESLFESIFAGGVDFLSGRSAVYCRV